MDDGPTPSTGRRSGPAIEIPLAGDGPLGGDVAGGQPDGESPPNWRKIVGIASLAGIGLGILLAAVLFAFVWNDDDTSGNPGDPPGDPATSLAGDDPAARITTPPTLSPLQTLPPVDGRGVPQRDRSLLDLVAVPTFPPADAGGATPLVPDGDGGFDLDVAIAALAADVPRRTTTHLELGVGGYQLDVEFLRDAADDRYAFSLDAGDGRTEWVVDGTDQQMYLDFSTADDPQWLPVDGLDFAGYYGFDTVGAMFDLLIRGPVREDTIGAATVSRGELVVLDDGSAARAYTVVLPGASIPEWQLYLLGPTSEFLPTDRPDRMTYTVYVGEGDQVRRIVGLADLGGLPQLVVHDIDTLPAPVTVALPDPATVNTGPPRSPG